MSQRQLRPVNTIEHGHLEVNTSCGFIVQTVIAEEVEMSSVSLVWGCEAQHKSALYVSATIRSASCGLVY